MTDHSSWQTALAHYRDLPAAERRALDTHLAGCADCRALLAEYERQDRALSAIPRLKPRQKAWQPQRPSASWVGRLGQGLALAGVAALLGVMALQLQYAGELAATSQNGTPGAGPAIEPGIALPPVTVAPPSAWLVALPWIGLALLVVGALFIIGRQRRWPAAAGAVLAAMLLVSFVPPLSALPNPAGLYWRVVGGYQYDPALPFKNDFLLTGRPEQILRPYLDSLIGAVGLSPLDPALPLARYEILRVGLHPQHKRIALVTVRFVYSDGSSRVYPVPLLDAAVDVGGFWLTGWRDDGLQRLRSDHLALAGQPFAGPNSPIQLGTTQQLATVSPAANRLDEVNPGHWLWSSVRVQHLVWAPSGQAFLAVMETDPAQRQLWQVNLDSSPPISLATGDIREYGWSPDGRTVVFTRFDAPAAQVDPRRPFAVLSVASGDGGQTPVPLAAQLPNAQLPGLTANGVWFFSEDRLWQMPYAGGQPKLILSGVETAEASGQPRPSPDRASAAFACGNDLCLVAALNSTAPGFTRVPNMQAAEIAWAPDGTQLAIVDRDPNGTRSVRLVVVTGAGEILHTAQIAPNDVTEAPQWTPDGEAIFVQTYPHDGRRIIAIDLPTGETLDLSREHWDTYFALAPDGQSLLLNNGRGNFWTTPVIRHP